MSIVSLVMQQYSNLFRSIFKDYSYSDLASFLKDWTFVDSRNLA